MLYGIDFKDSRTSLTDLLWKLDRIPGDFWVRVLYSYPSEITEEFIDWLNNSKHAVKYVDVPLQHTVPEVLVKMNRRQAIEASLVAADALRLTVVGVTLRTTIITGFPGETENRFRRLLADIKRMQFDHLGAFAYSPEEGTKGAKLKGRPSRKKALEREKAIMDAAAEIWAVKAKRMLGGVYKALVTAPGVARMESQAPDVDGVTYVDSDQVGEFINVKLTKVKGFDFKAKQID
jgi:ribosomal protein S12 methylthiotransferase